MSGSQAEIRVSREQLDVLACIEQCFWETGLVPTNERVSELTGVSLTSVERYWTLQWFREAIQKRGIDLTPRPNNLLTIEQLNLANRVLNPHDSKSVREHLKECGVSPQQYQAWLRDPAFTAYLGNRAKQMFESSDHELYQTLMGAIRGGDVRALQMGLEMRGIYDPKAQNDIPIDLILIKVIEILARHIRDPRILQEIANEFEHLDVTTSSGQPVLIPVLDVSSELVPAQKEFVL